MELNFLSICSLAHSLSNYSLRSQSWPGTVLGAERAAVNQTRLRGPLGSPTLVIVHVSERLVFIQTTKILQHLKQKLLSGHPRIGKKELSKEDFPEGRNNSSLNSFPSFSSFQDLLTWISLFERTQVGKNLQTLCQPEILMTQNGLSQKQKR